MADPDGEATFRFSDLEEAICTLEAASSPFNIHLEVASASPLVADRLREAVATACRRHVLGSVRRRRRSATDPADEWERTDELDVDPVRVDDAGVEHARRTLCAEAITLDRSPPLRVVLARGDAGDSVLFDLSHVAVDGIGAARFVRSITTAYRGDADPADPIPLAAARDIDARRPPAPWWDLSSVATEGLRRFGEALDPPVLVAPSGGDDGSGFVFTTRVVAAMPNDALLAGVGLAIDRWNTGRGEGPGRIGLVMPVSLRPPAWSSEVVTNLAAFITVSLGTADRTDLAGAVAAVARQTAPPARDARVDAFLDALRAARHLPMALRRAVPTLLAAAGNRLLGTAIVSNLGRLDPPPCFEGSGPPAVWFSPPCAMPLGVGVGAVTVHDRMHLTVRSCRAQFGSDAAEAFADLVVEQLAVS